MFRNNTLVYVVMLSLVSSLVRATITYDGKSFMINGEGKILISGSIHYPRSTPEMWPDLIQQAKDGGLDVRPTYVFWNVHEPSPGQYNFQGRADHVKFLKLVQAAGLYVHLRIGPYICAGWNFGGFPICLKYVPGIQFRTDNGPFKVKMEGFVTKIVDLLKPERLFEPQGGPIITSQIENEYGPIEWEIGAPGKAYSAWAAQMAVAQKTDVPWVMCTLPDCKTVVYNTATVNSPTTWPRFTPVAGKINWQSFNEWTPSADDRDTVAMNGLWEQISVTRDSSDYLWYLTDINIAADEGFLKGGQWPLLTVMSAGHALHVFVNGQLSGMVYGSLNKPKLTFSKNVKLNAGINKIALLSVAVGLAVSLNLIMFQFFSDYITVQDSHQHIEYCLYFRNQNVGLHFEQWNTGVLGPVTLSGLEVGTTDLTKQKWNYKVGLHGESLNLNTLSGSSSVEWVQGTSLAYKKPLTWYKATFTAPPGNDLVAIDMGSMGKGEIWVNGQSIGRHWPAYIAQGNCAKCNYAGTYSGKKCQLYCGTPSQRWYHLTRSLLNSGPNFLVVFEELGGDPYWMNLAIKTRA